MPQSVIGIMNSRDRVFCVFDLAQLLGLPTKLFTPRQYQIIVLQTTSPTPVRLGLAVNTIQGIMRLASEQITPLEAVSDESCFLCIWCSNGGESYDTRAGIRADFLRR